ncbi:hypothetical protein ACIGJK_03700 [Pseudomonas iridis]|uniref:hypothetical protein n=1 Tax=Pseudomonas iridis TaxID=2710587 RepID=UPI0037C7831A
MGVLSLGNPLAVPRRNQGAGKGLPLDFRIGALMDGGMVIGLIRQADGIHGLIISPKSAEVSVPWATNTTASGVAADETNGKSNTDALVKLDASKYLAAAYCASYGSGWMLPAKNQLEMAYRVGKPSAVANSGDQVYGLNPDSIPYGPAYTAGNPVMTTLPQMLPDGDFSLSLGNYWSSSVQSGSSVFRQNTNGGAQVASSPTVNSAVRPFKTVLLVRF